jgi:hypothetical protein
MVGPEMCRLPATFATATARRLWSYRAIWMRLVTVKCPQDHTGSVQPSPQCYFVSAPVRWAAGCRDALPIPGNHCGERRCSDHPCPAERTSAAVAFLAYPFRRGIPPRGVALRGVGGGYLVSAKECCSVELDDARTIGAGLRQIRNSRGKSLRVVAGLAGISKSQLSEFERGERSASTRAGPVARSLVGSVRGGEQNTPSRTPCLVSDRVSGGFRRV